MGILIQITGLLACLSFLVLTHELGHYMFARIFKTRVDKFYLFFNPGFSILRAKKCEGEWKFSFCSKQSPEEWKNFPNNTEWGIGWLPLGGYCSINGMVDETTKANELPQEPQPYEFRSKKTWQRLFIIVGGVLMNFITALILFPIILFVWGKTYVPLQNAKYGMQFTEIAKQEGFKDGDKIVLIDGKQVNTLYDFVTSVLIDGVKEVTVNRNDNVEQIFLSSDFPKKLMGDGVYFCDFNFPFIVDSIPANSNAAKSILKKGDSIVAVNLQQYISFFQYSKFLADNANSTVNLSFYREGQLLTDSVMVDSLGKIGIYYCRNFITPVTENFTILSSFPEGIKMGVKTLVDYVKQFKLMASKEGAKQVGSFISIGKMFSKVWDWHRFWSMTAFLAVALAFMNILPIPALDGGYILFILYEMIFRKKPGDKFLQYANMVGWILLIMLVFYATGMDIARLFS